MNWNPFDSDALFGAGKPLSRPQAWASITVPGMARYGAGVPPIAPTAKALKSSEYTPVQFSGGGLPPELMATERLSGVLTQRRPPRKGTAALPALLYRYRPGLLLRTLTKLRHCIQFILIFDIINDDFLLCCCCC